MPLDDTSPGSPELTIGPSAAVELAWLLYGCHKDEPLVRLPPELDRRVAAFWGDGETFLVETMVISHQLGCLDGWDITPMFDVPAGRLTVGPDLTLDTETPAQRDLTRARLGRLADDAKLRRSFGALMRDLWEFVGPTVEELGRPAVERATARLCSSLEHGLAPMDLFPANHITHRTPEYRAMTEAAIRAGTAHLAPSYLAGPQKRGHIIALPGVFSIAMGTGVDADGARRRNDAERVAGGLKLLGDPTRVMILGELDRQPATVGEIATRVGVAQPTASVHIRQLREAGLVEAERDNGRVAYRVRRADLQRVLDDAQSSLLP